MASWTNDHCSRSFDRQTGTFPDAVLVVKATNWFPSSTTFGSAASSAITAPCTRGVATAA